MEGILMINGQYSQIEAYELCEGLQNKNPKLFILITNDGELSSTKFIPKNKKRGKAFREFKKEIKRILLKSNMSEKEKDILGIHAQEFWKEKYSNEKIH